MAYEFIGYKGLKSTVKDGETIELVINGYDNPLGEASYLIKIKRSDPNEESIKRDVRNLYKDRLANPSLYDDVAEIRKEMEAEIVRRIDQARKDWQLLPQATIFEVFMRKIERKKDCTFIVAWVSLAASSYFIQHKKELDRMMFDFEKIPYFTFNADKSKYVMKYVDEFIEEFTVTDGDPLRTQEPLIIAHEFDDYRGISGIIGDIVGDVARVDKAIAKNKSK